MPSQRCKHNRQKRDCPECKQYHAEIMRGVRAKKSKIRAEIKAGSWMCINCKYPHNITDEYECHRCGCKRKS